MQYLDKNEKSVAEFLKNQEIVRLINGLESKEISLMTVSQNLKVSAGYVNKYTFASVIGKIAMLDCVSVDGLMLVFKKADLKSEAFSMENWILPERKERITMSFTLGECYQLPHTSGKQNVTCVYCVVWFNDSYVTFLPIENLATNDDGLRIDNPRTMGISVVPNLKPVKVSGKDGDLKAL